MTGCSVVRELIAGWTLAEKAARCVEAHFRTATIVDFALIQVSKKHKTFRNIDLHDRENGMHLVLSGS